jgi:hypothetical protein
MGPRRQQPIRECPYCHRPERAEPEAVNGLAPVGDAPGCEFCDPEPAPDVRADEHVALKQATAPPGRTIERPRGSPYCGTVGRDTGREARGGAGDSDAAGSPIKIARLAAERTLPLALASYSDEPGPSSIGAPRSAKLGA